MNYIIANWPLFLAVLIIGVLMTCLIRQGKRIIGALLTVMMLFAVLSFFGVPMEQIEAGFQHGVSRFEQMLNYTKEVLPEFMDSISDFFGIPSDEATSYTE